MNEESSSETAGLEYSNMDREEGAGGVVAAASNTCKTNHHARRRGRRSSLIFHESIRQSLRRKSSIRRQSIQERPQTEPAAPPALHASCIESLTYFYSIAILIFSVTLVMGVIFTKQTSATADTEMGLSPVLVFLVFWILICWLAMMEGGQGALVGLQPIEKDLYAESHPVSLKTTSLAYKGDNMERFIVGRQFLVVLVVFAINILGSPAAAAAADTSLWDLNQTVMELFLGSGLALILITLILGQLVAQVNAADCMLDFINNYVMLFTTYLALGIETLGLLHCTYLVQMLFSKDKNDDKQSNNEPPPRSILQSIFFWLRVFMSLALLGFAFAVTLSALFNGQTTMWEGVPNVVSVIIFFSLMCFVGMMEGMQIALFAVINLPEEQLQQHAVAHRNCRVIFSGENMQALLIGRQICVTVCTFVVARITTINVDKDEETIFGVPPGVQSFFNTGLLGALITTIVASLAWRIIAASFPIAFLSNPLISVIIRLCLVLEMSGICSAAWVLARFVKAIMKYEPDEVYLDEVEPHGSEPITVRDEDIDRLFLRSSIASLQSRFLAHEIV